MWERPPASSMHETYTALECSALHNVHIVLHTNKTYPKRCDYLVSFNLNLDLFTLALKNLYVKILARKKCRGRVKVLLNVESIFYDHAAGSHRKGMKEPHVALEPWDADPLFKTYQNAVHIKIILSTLLLLCQFVPVEHFCNDNFTMSEKHDW